MREPARIKRIYEKLKKIYPTNTLIDWYNDKWNDNNHDLRFWQLVSVHAPDNMLEEEKEDFENLSQLVLDTIKYDIFFYEDDQFEKILDALVNDLEG